MNLIAERIKENELDGGLIARSYTTGDGRGRQNSTTAWAMANGPLPTARQPIAEDFGYTCA